jgi:hypothetical protein
MLAAQLALQTAWVMGLFGPFKSEQFFVGEALHRDHEFSPLADAILKVLLHCGLGVKLFVANLARVILPVVPERGIFIYQ